MLSVSSHVSFVFGNHVHHTKSLTLYLLSAVFVSEAASYANKRSSSKSPDLPSRAEFWTRRRYMFFFTISVWFVLQDSPGRTTSGSPRPAGRAGPTTVTGGSPMASVKKPDPNIKGTTSGGLIKMAQSFSLGFCYATNFILGFILWLSVLKCCKKAPNRCYLE